MHRFVKEHRFPNALALEHALVGEIRVDLQEAIDARGTASLVVSGGRTPVNLFRLLGAEPIDWSRVWVTLADERWVDTADGSSNERLIRESLLAGAAAKARFIGLKNASAAVEQGLEWSWRALTRIVRPLDVVLLGMGDDGHTASLFPTSPGLAAALDTSAAPACVAMRAPAAPHERMSLNLSALLDARRLVLHIVGAEKWQVYLKAREPGPVTEFPVRGILHQQQVPVDVFWSP
ncbi:MAG: 6-phosphogluconolactonase [Steroidobacteraceae bacterium]